MVLCICVGVILFLGSTFLNSCVSQASTDQKEELIIAVASNFSVPMEEICERYTKETGVEITLSFASSGKHYAQIVNGAPFDLFFSADQERPRLLVESGKAVNDSQFTYATGRLALLSGDQNGDAPDFHSLATITEEKLAIANPKLAPYGAAAREVIIKLGHWDRLEGSIVLGENINQAYQFVYSGNVAMGFVALSQAIHTKGLYWEVPKELHTPIFQDAVIVRDSKSSRNFISYIQSEETQTLLQDFGYGVPH